MAFGRTQPSEDQPPQAGFGRSDRSFGRTQSRGTQNKVFSSMPGSIVRHIGKYEGSYECVGGAREVVTDIPNGLYDYEDKLNIINSTVPEAGSVAVMPSGGVGHLGVVVGQSGEDVWIYDVNADGQNSKMLRKVPADKIDGYFKGEPANVNNDLITSYQTEYSTPPKGEEHLKIDEAQKETQRLNVNRNINMIDMTEEERGGLKAEVDNWFDKGIKGTWNEWTKLNRDQIPVVDPVLGVLKGVIETMDNASFLGERGIRAVTSFVADKLGAHDFAEVLRNANKTDKTAANMLESALGLSEGQLTVADNGWQEAGKFLEMMAEFMVAGYVAGAAVPAAAPTTYAGKLLQLGKLGVAEGTAAGGVTAIKERDLNGKVAFSALLAGSFPALMAGFSSVGKALSSNVKSLLTKAIRPSSKNYGKFSGAIDDVIKEVHKRGYKIETLDDLNNAIKEVADDVWKTVDDAYRVAGEKAVTVSGDDIVKKTIAKLLKDPTIKKFLREGGDDAMAKIESLLSSYKGQIGITEADDLLRAINLENSSLYSSAGGVGSAREMSVQKIVNKALGRFLKEGIDDSISYANLPAVKHIRELYGKLATVSPEVQNRAIVTARNNSINLQQSLNVPSGVGDIARGDVVGGALKIGSSQLIKGANSPGVQIKSAFNLLDETISGVKNPTGLGEGFKGFMKSIFMPSQRTVLSGALTLGQEGIPGTNIKPQKALLERDTLDFDKIQLPSNIQIGEPQANMGAQIGGQPIQPQEKQGLLEKLIPQANASGGMYGMNLMPKMPPTIAPQQQAPPARTSPAPSSDSGFYGMNLIPSAHAKPSIPKKPAILQTPVSPAKPRPSLFDMVAPNLARNVKIGSSLATQFGRLTPQMLKDNAPQTDAKGGIMGNIQQHNQQLQDAISQTSGKQPAMNVPILQTLKKSPTGQAINKWTNIFRKSFNF